MYVVFQLNKIIIIFSFFAFISVYNFFKSK